MKVFKMADVEKIETALADGKVIEIEWHTPYEKGTKCERVISVRWDGLVFTTGECVYTGIDKLVALNII